MPTALCHIIQNLLLEENDEIRLFNLHLWRRIIKSTPTAVLTSALQQHINTWLELITTPERSIINQSLLLLPRIEDGDAAFASKRSKQDSQAVTKNIYMVGGFSQAIAPKYVHCDA